MEKLLEWIEINNLDVQINFPFLEVPNFGKLLFIQPKNGLVFTEGYSLGLSEEEYRLAENIDYLLFQLGDKFYYTDKIEKPDLHPFKYVGNVKTIFPQPDLPFLGIHSGYDLCNGSRTYEDWCKKAKFLGITTLGIAETNTLAGAIAFQKACEKEGINGIVGETVRVEHAGEVYHIKLYPINREVGWRNLLLINAELNVHSAEGSITEEVLFKHADGLICVLTPDISLSKVHDKYVGKFHKLFYQLDLVEWDSATKDEQWCTNIQEYITSYQSKLAAVLISDGYYLDEEDNHIRRSLSLIVNANFRNNSKRLYFKTIDNYFTEALEVFTDDDQCFDFIVTAIENTVIAFQDIKFKVVTGQFYLPKYQMTAQEQINAPSNEALLWTFIEKGFQNKVVDQGLNQNVYNERVLREVEVIKKGGFIDYFLILADMYRFCDEQNIWYGVGRGSAAGSLVSYLCNIVSIDPIHYDLLFERFLNEGRLGKSLPDIDCDIMGSRRNEVKRYLEEKYGVHNVMSIGTYGTFKLKNAIKDLARIKGVDNIKVGMVSKILPDTTESAYHDLFLTAAGNSLVYEFIQDNAAIIETLPLLLNQPKNASMHAAGLVIVPKEYGTAYEQLPVKKVDGVLLSEWEGSYIDDAGYLKIDLLGLKQINKFYEIAQVIKQQLNITIKLDDINVNDPEVLALFKDGFTEDVFQFGALGLKSYCKELKPDSVEDLIATVALYRPGPMESGIHKKYIKVKNGFERVEYDKGTEEITKKTYGQIIYQEQIMKVFTDVGGFSLVEADDMRKAISKTTISREVRLKSLQGYMDRWYSQGEQRGYNRNSLAVLWEKIEKFATYSFNRSHAACYAITGYYCQWFKVKYPIQFWTVCLQNSDDKEIPFRISEMQKVSSIEASPVDINKSDVVFTGDPDTNSIYWALPSVKYVGDKIVESIFQERNTNGLFFSLEEFYNRTKSLPGVNKRSITNLIISGAFDKIEKIINITDRYKLIESFYKFTNEIPKEELLEMKSWKDYQWTLKQKELTGFGIFDFNKIVHQSDLASKVGKYQEIQYLLEMELDSTVEVLVAGLLVNVIERKSRNGPFAQLEIRDNTDSIFITCWSQVYEPIKATLKNSINKIVVLNGRLGFDNYKRQNSIQTDKLSKLQII